MHHYRLMYQVKDRETDSIITRRIVNFKTKHKVTEPMILSNQIIDASWLSLCAAWPAVAWLKDQTSLHGLMKSRFEHLRMHTAKLFGVAAGEKSFVEISTELPSFFMDEEGILMEWSTQVKIVDRKKIVTNLEKPKKKKTKQGK